MGLVEVQRALARLYTDGALRGRFFAHLRPVSQELGLSDDEAAQIATISAIQVGRFADSLVAKRRHEVEKLLPLTRRVLGREFSAEFARYASAPVPDGMHRHREDAIAFAAFLGNSDGRPGPPWAMDLLRYERSWLEAGSSRRRWLVRRFQYPVGRLARNLVEDTVLPSVPFQPTLGVWFRLGRHGPLRHLLLPFV